MGNNNSSASLVLTKTKGLLKAVKKRVRKAVGNNDAAGFKVYYSASKKELQLVDVHGKVTHLEIGDIVPDTARIENDEEGNHWKQIVPSLQDIHQMWSGTSTENSFPRYVISVKYPGHVTIITNSNFSDPSLRYRDGTKNDDAKLKQVFWKLGFEVILKTDLTAQHMKSTVDDLATTPEFRRYSCILLVVSSHGKGSNGIEVLFGADGEEVTVNSIQETLGESKTLLGKPKAVLIQACRGSKPVKELGGAEADSCRRPEGSDLIIARATIPDRVAWRHTKTGSYFLQMFCEVLAKHANTMHICDILTIVNSELATTDHGRSLDETTKVVCNSDISRNSLHKHFYLTPRRSITVNENDVVW